MIEQKATFYKVYPDAIAPLAADPSALGSLPTGAFQYCEPIRTASSFGWHIFPPKDMQLLFDGNEVFYADEGQWEPIIRVPFEQDYLDYWDTHCPEDLKGRTPPFLSSTFVPGIVQIWSGLLISTAEKWSTLVRPLANADFSSSYRCYEGIVETDAFGPWPLFINIRMTATHRPVHILKERPFFQVQAIPRESYARDNATAAVHKGLEDGNNKEVGMGAGDWAGFRKTIRSVDPTEEPDRKVGQYAVNARKRSKKNS